MELLYIIALMITGMAAGIASGMLGVGGCFIMVPVQFWVLESMGFDQKTATMIAFGTSLAVAFPTAINGAVGHFRRGSVASRAAILLGLSGLVGAVLGGSVAARAPGELLRFIFGLVLLIASFRMVVGNCVEADDAGLGVRAERTEGARWARQKGQEWVACEVRVERDAYFLAMGLPLGFVCGLIGIGGGTLMVPMMVLFLGFGMHQAVGTSTAAIIFTSAGGAISYVANGLEVPGLPPHSLGYVNLLQWALLAGTSIPMARVGVRAAHRLSPDRLKLVFAVVMLYIALKMMASSGLLPFALSFPFESELDTLVRLYTR